MHASTAPSDWILRWAHLAPAGHPVLDVACGAGRHLMEFSGRGHPVTGVDRDPQALAAAAWHLDGAGELVQADIENGPWPFAGQVFGAVVVTNYLWRTLLPTLVASVDPGGVLLYQTFAVDNQTVGNPSLPDILLRPGELLAACAGLRVVAYEDGFETAPERFVQRVAAVREPRVGAVVRYPL
ncbi:MAG: class I SAM-dependent methyltransferase [Ramlibacter sp.]